MLPDLSLRQMAEKAGKQPGLVKYTGDIRIDTSFYNLAYNRDGFEEVQHASPLDVLEGIKEKRVDWVDIFGLSNEHSIHELCDSFKIHPLLQEDIVNTAQLPKMEDFGEHVFVTLKMLNIGEDGQIEQEHVSLILGESVVLAFQERPGDVFDDIRIRIKEYIGRVRERGADYLFFMLIDSIVDRYFSVFERVRQEIEELELLMLNKRRDDYADEIISLRKELILLRKWVMPLREALARLRRSESKLIDNEWKYYLADTQDQLEHILAFFDSFRDMLNYLMDLNYSNLTNQTNEIVKTLTVISAIFIPLTFLAGLYGMNFKHMPELEHENGYFILLGVMFLIFVGSIIALKRRNWW